MKKALWVLVVLVVLVGLVLFMGRDDQVALPGFSWQFTEAGTTDDGFVPLTAVTLQTSSGESYDLGTYEGTCADMVTSSWELLENEIAGAICWFAGGGREIGMFQRDGELVVVVGDIEEGTAETEGFRENFSKVLTLDM
jgi:hypothetical protein